jgi:hypothetical protein
VALKAAKWALVGPVLAACGGQKKAAYPTFRTFSLGGSVNRGGISRVCRTAPLAAP